jgi:NAD(P)-dependent dehydrogenase (short-subunit alcohol dehydrogenase family)
VIEDREVPFWESDLQDLWRVVETNLRGPLIVTRAVLPAMVQRGHGHVVNVVSLAHAATRSGTYTGYAVSKRAMSLFTESLVGPLAGTGVVVLDVLPGLVRTALTESMPTWNGVIDWDDAAATARLVVAIARGEHDEKAGAVLKAIEDGIGP